MKKNILLILSSLFYSISLLAATPEEGQVPDAIEFAALKNLYLSTGGAMWTNNTNWPTTWPSSATSTQFGTWFGITVANGDITTITLDGNNLIGTIPSEIGNLSQLSEIRITGNQLSGPIPSSIGNLTNMYYLDFSNNQLSGSIPESISGMVNIRYLYLHDNQLSGPIPQSISTMTSLGYFQAWRNQLSGNFPDLSALHSMDQIIVNYNQLSGTIPASYLPPAVNDFQVAANHFTGVFPDISGLGRIYDINISGNQFEGDFPSFNGLNHLTNISLEDNKLTSIPNDILNLPVLNYVGLSNNSLKSLPDFSNHVNKANLRLRIDYNYLDFSTLEPLANVGLQSLVAFPQKNIHDIDQNLLTINSALTIPSRPLSANTTITWQRQDSNSGNWIDVTSLSADATHDTFLRNTAALTDEGTYRWITTNTLFPDQTIQSDPITVGDEGNVPDAIEFAALKDLYMSTGGATWTNNANWPTTWPASATSAEFGTWYGVTVENGDVTKIGLNHNNLMGNLSESLLNLSSLAWLTVGGNQLSGNFPTVIFSLPNLQFVDLAYNQLSGEIPSFAAAHFNLNYLSMGANGFTGNFPDLSSQTNLYALNLSYTQFDAGPFPAALSGLINLSQVYLDQTNLTGPLPDFIGNLTQMSTLSLGNNQLTGPIPNLSNLTSLQQLILWYNPLNTTIPSSFGNLTTLTYLLIDNAGLIGSIPSEMGNLTNLTALSLSNNQLTGSIPTSFGNLTKLQALELVGNQLSGSIPSTVGNLHDLVYLYLNDNSLTGSIPAEIAACTQLRELIVSNNQLNGLPDLHMLTALNHIGLDHNNFTGSVPSWIGNFPDLWHLLLNDNKFTGELPASIGSPSNLINLFVSNNQLEGNFPAVDNLVELQNLSADGNRFTSITTSILTLPSLRILNFDNNELTSLPNFAAQVNKNNLQVVVSNNRLDFSQLETFSTAGIAYPSYFPQKNIHDVDQFFLTISNALTISSRPLTSNTTIAWQKLDSNTGNWNDVTNLSADATHDTFLRNTAALTDEGTYRWITTNTLFPDQVIQSDPITVGSEGSVPDAIEFAALKDLYLSTGGATWTNNTNWPTTWPASATSAEFGTWFGVVVQDGDVIDFELASNNLTGTLPASFKNFQSLNRFYFNYNNLSGPLPVFSGSDIPNLQYMNFSFNQFTGSIPSSYTSLNQLALMDLTSNSLSGTIPPYLSAMTSLQDLRLSSNPFTPGPIPSWINQLTNLHVLYLNGNNLNGSIPASLGDLHSLQYLGLDYNSLTGGLPSTITNCPNLIQIDLLYNQLTDLTTDLRSLTQLSYLGLSNNNFSGALPDWLGYVPNLNILMLNNNNFTGNIPASFSNLSNLIVFSVFDNQLTGALPDATNLINLSSLDASNNNLNEPIPASYSALANMTVFNVGYNQIPGQLPNISNWLQLQSLSLTGNPFTGAFPDVSALNSLTYVESTNTQFSSIPVSVINLPHAYYISFQRNAITTITDLNNLHQGPDLGILFIDNNYLDFSQIDKLANAGVPLFAFPQKNIHDLDQKTFTVNSSLTIPSRPLSPTTSIVWETQDADNSWTDVTANSEDATKNTYFRSQAALTDQGVYRWRTTDTMFPDQTIQSDPITVGLQVVDAPSIGVKALYNGLITSVRWHTDKAFQTTEQDYEGMYVYDYDEKYQLKDASWAEANNSLDNFTMADNKFRTTALQYDPNGNIQTLHRYDQTGMLTNNFSYQYAANKNQLLSVNGYASAYTYNELGQTTAVDKETGEDQYIEYDVTGKVTAVYSDAGKTQIRVEYLYDDRGLRLAKKAYNDQHTLDHTTWYIRDASGNVLSIYEEDNINSTLAQTEVTIYGAGKLGTLYPQQDGFTNYEITDHLGNVRALVREESFDETATMEAAHVEDERSKFLRYDNVRKIYSPIFDHTNNTAVSTNGYAIRLSGSANEKRGLAKSFAIAPGDKIHLEVYAKYLDQNQSNWSSALNTLISQVVSGTAGTGTVVDGAGYAGNSSTPLPFPDLLDTEGSSGPGPKAYLNWLIFDKDFVFVSGGYKRISDAAKETGNDVPHEKLEQDLVINDPGYIYIYLSNDEETPVEVYFDDFEVTHNGNYVSQATDYGAWGDIIREQKSQLDTTYLYRYAYQGQFSERDLETGWNHFELREYDPVLGRWTTVDKARQFWASYSAMGNNPVNYTDPNGAYSYLGALWRWLLSSDPSAIYKAGDGPYDYGFNDSNGVGQFGSNRQVITGFSETSIPIIKDPNLDENGGSFNMKLEALKYKTYDSNNSYPYAISEGNEFSLLSGSMDFRGGPRALGIVSGGKGSVGTLKENIDAGFFMGENGKHGWIFDLNAGAYTAEGEVYGGVTLGGITIKTITGASVLSAHMGVTGGIYYDEESGNLTIEGLEHLGEGLIGGKYGVKIIIPVNAILEHRTGF